MKKIKITKSIYDDFFESYLYKLYIFLNSFKTEKNFN